MIEVQKITDVIQHLEGLKAVIFDLDDTLYSEKEYVRSGYSAVSDTLPQIKDAEKKLWKAFKEKKSAIDVVLSDEDIYTEELKQQCLETYRYHKPNISVYDGVYEMLSKIHENGCLIGLITDGRPEGQWAKIEALNLKKYVDYIIVTDELGGVSYRKPNEAAFVLMRNHFDISYENMCYIGDNTKKDFIAPEKLGMRTIWFRNTDGLYYGVS